MQRSLVILLVALVAGCSARGGYEGIQASARNECARLPPSQSEDCMARADRSYEEYVREREALRDAESDEP